MKNDSSSYKGEKNAAPLLRVIFILDIRVRVTDGNFVIM